MKWITKYAWCSYSLSLFYVSVKQSQQFLLQCPWETSSGPTSAKITDEVLRLMPLLSSCSTKTGISQWPNPMTLLYSVQAPHRIWYQEPFLISWRFLLPCFLWHFLLCSYPPYWLLFVSSSIWTIGIPWVTSFVVLLLVTSALCSIHACADFPTALWWAWTFLLKHRYLELSPSEYVCPVPVIQYGVYHR